MRSALVLCSLIWIAFSPSLRGEFQFDDAHSIKNNTAIHSLSNIPRFWTDRTASSVVPENRVYRPATHSLHAICWAVAGGETWPFHVIKLALHWLCCLMFLWIWTRLAALRKGPELELHVVGVMAVVFSVHPAISETVGYIAATSTLLCATFYLAAYLAYLRFRESGSRRFLALSLGAFFFSVMSKEEGITLPAVVALTELYWIPRSLELPFASRIRKHVMPFAVFAVALGALLYVTYPPKASVSRGSITPGSYFITQWRAYLHYMGTWLWPWDLNADNVSFGFSKSISDSRVIQAALGNALLLGGAWLLRKPFPALLFGLLWFYITVSPASSIVPLAEPVNEHRTYLSFVGWWGGLAYSIYQGFLRLPTLRGHERKWAGAFVLLVSLLVFGSQQRSRLWASPELLWKDTLAKNPESGRAMNNLALAHMGRSEFIPALELLENCERVWATYQICAVNKGIVLASLGKPEAAEASFQRALSIYGDSYAANLYYGYFLRDSRRDPASASIYLDRAAAIAGTQEKKP